MTAKEGYFGSDAKENRFLAIPSGKGKNEKYFMQVNKDTGRMEVWNEEFGQDRYVGEYDPETKKFKPAGGILGKGARDFEREFFTSQKGKRLISQNSAKVVEKDLIAEGKTPDEAMIEAAELTKESSRLVKSQLSSELTKGGKDKIGTRREFGTMVYPETLRQSEQDVIKFTILKYQPRGFKARENSLDFFGERSIFKGREPVGTVVLPIPGGIKDQNQVSWADDKMSATQIALSDIALSTITGGVGAGLDSAQGVVGRGQSNISDIKKALSATVSYTHLRAHET